MSTICAQVCKSIFQNHGIYHIQSLNQCNDTSTFFGTEIKISFSPQNDVNLTTAFEGEDIPNFGVFTDHQVDDTIITIIIGIGFSFQTLFTGETREYLVFHQYLT